MLNGHPIKNSALPLRVRLGVRWASGPPGSVGVNRATPGDLYGLTGGPYGSTADPEEEKCRDLVVLGSRGASGFATFLLGSVSNQVAHHASCPVVIVPAQR
jgi:hypothetical protein